MHPHRAFRRPQPPLGSAPVCFKGVLTLDRPASHHAPCVRAESRTVDPQPRSAAPLHRLCSHREPVCHCPRHRSNEGSAGRIAHDGLLSSPSPRISQSFTARPMLQSSLRPDPSNAAAQTPPAAEKGGLSMKAWETAPPTSPPERQPLNFTKQARDQVGLCNNCADHRRARGRRRVSASILQPCLLSHRCPR